MLAAFRKKSELPEYLSHYGMHRAPFSTAIEDDMYYADPVRHQRLDVLLHLTQNSNELLVIVGEEGMGKTTFISQFLQNAPEHWKICFVEGHKMMTEEQFLERVYQGFNIAHASTQKGTMLTNLRKRLENMLEDAIPIILVIDDAHLFSTKVLALMLDIASIKNTKTGGSIRILLASEPQIKIMLAEPSLENSHDLIVRKIDLPPLDEKNTGNYLHHRLTQAGMVVEQFLTKPTISKIYKSSDGIPKKINEAADRLLFDTTPIIRRNSNIQSERSSSLLKIVVISLLFALIIGIAAYIYKSQIEPVDKEKNENISETTTTLKLPAIETLGETPQKTAPKKTADELIDPMQSLKDELADKTDSQSTTSPSVALPERNQSKQSVDTTAPQTAEKEATAPDANETQAIMVTDETIESPESQAKSDEPVASTESDTQAVMVTEAMDNQTPGLKDNAWVLEQNPNHYTLQLVAGLQKQTINNFIKKYQLSGRLIYFSSKRNEKIWHNLSYGIYPDRKSANQAIKNLPASLANEKPWIRQLSAIQSEIRRMSQP